MSEEQTGKLSGLGKLVDSILRTHNVPAYAVVSQSFEIVQFRGSTGLFLESGDSRNLLKMARPGLKFELRNAIHKVSQSGKPFKKSGLKLVYKGCSCYVSIEVLPLKPDSHEKYFIIIFEETMTSATLRDKKVKQLEADLMIVREDMNSLLEEQEIVNEELERRVRERTAALQEANRSLQQSNSELEQFAYVASHDLQEPLRKIITYADMLSTGLSGKLAREAQGYLDKISRCSQRMQQLIQDLLDISRVDISKEKFVKTDLKAILEDVVQDFDHLISEKGAQLRVGLLPVIEAVPAQVKQLFHNLLSNALKFTSSSRKPLIELSSRQLPKMETGKRPSLDKTRAYYEILFKDNGIGFNPAFAEQVFVIFQRLHPKEKFPGTGIGLALCKKIVVNHGGEIWAEPEDKKGTVFHIVLPAAFSHT